VGRKPPGIVRTACEIEVRSSSSRVFRLGQHLNDLEDVLALAAVKNGVAPTSFIHAAHVARRMRPMLWPPAPWTLFGRVMQNACFVAHPNPSLEYSNKFMKAMGAHPAGSQCLFRILW